MEVCDRKKIKCKEGKKNRTSRIGKKWLIYVILHVEYRKMIQRKGRKDKRMKVE